LVPFFVVLLGFVSSAADDDVDVVKERVVLLRPSAGRSCWSHHRHGATAAAATGDAADGADADASAAAALSARRSASAPPLERSTDIGGGYVIRRLSLSLSLSLSGARRRRGGRSGGECVRAEAIDRARARVCVCGIA
jgi:hypothetical protein